jgi:hypothetical protein
VRRSLVSAVPFGAAIRHGWSPLKAAEALLATRFAGVRSSRPNYERRMNWTLPIISQCAVHGCISSPGEPRRRASMLVYALEVIHGVQYFFGVHARVDVWPYPRDTSALIDEKRHSRGHAEPIRDAVSGLGLA